MLNKRMNVGRLQGDITVMRRQERTQVEDLSREDDLKEDKLLLG